MCPVMVTFSKICMILLCTFSSCGMFVVGIDRVDYGCHDVVAI